MYLEGFVVSLRDTTKPVNRFAVSGDIYHQKTQTV